MSSITVSGVEGGLLVDEWAHIAKRMVEAIGDEHVFSGGVVTLSGADFSVSAAEWLVPGAVGKSTVAELVPIPTNTSSQAQTVTVCGQVAWYDGSSNPTTEATAGSFVAILGTPERAEGSVWQCPFFQGTLEANSTTVTGLVDVRPVGDWVSFSPSSGDVPFGSTIAYARYRVNGNQTATLELSRQIGSDFSPAGGNFGDLNAIAPGNLPKPARPTTNPVYVTGHLNDVPISLRITTDGRIVAVGGSPASSSVVYPSGSSLNLTAQIPLG